MFYILKVNTFGEFHRTDRIINPIKITPKFIYMKEYVQVYNNARIEGVSKYNEILYCPKIIFKRSVTIQQNLHLTCANSIVVGENTAIAANVTITDIHHPYLDVNIPIERQDLKVGFVEIGDDCKIYNNAVILQNTRLGKHVTVGANSVVSGVFPDYCVIVGAPAKIVRRYDFTMSKWRKTNSEGDFVD